VCWRLQLWSSFWQSGPYFVFSALRTKNYIQVWTGHLIPYVRVTPQSWQTFSGANKIARAEVRRVISRDPLIHLRMWQLASAQSLVFKVLMTVFFLLGPYQLNCWNWGWMHKAKAKVSIQTSESCHTSQRNTVI